MNHPEIVHHTFDWKPEEFEARKAWPIKGTTDWKGEFASQSPLNQMHVVRDGKGAEGSTGYLALRGENSDQFYAEDAPRWHRPRKTYDLRGKGVSVFLKAVTPLKISPGYEPYIFIDDYNEADNSYCGWYLTQPLRVGNDWAFNEAVLVNDEKRWVRYSPCARSLDTVLSNVGFIGVMYLRGKDYKGVNATGILGIDEFKYNIPLPRK
jgi:hypothetical protein